MTEREAIIAKLKAMLPRMNREQRRSFFALLRRKPGGHHAVKVGDSWGAVSSRDIQA